jgi:hypothetical protein
MAGPEGVEPPLTEPESAVLPLDEGPMNQHFLQREKIRYMRLKEFASTNWEEIVHRWFSTRCFRKRAYLYVHVVRVCLQLDSHAPSAASLLTREAIPLGKRRAYPAGAQVKLAIRVNRGMEGLRLQSEVRELALMGMTVGQGIALST